MPDLTRLASRTVIRATGGDVRELLQGLVTNDVTHIAPGRLVYACLLTPQGKFLFDMFLSEAEDGAILMDVDAERRDALLKRLSLYKLRADAAFEAADDLAVFISDREIENGAPDPRLAALGWRRMGPVNLAASHDETAYHTCRMALGAPDAGADMTPEGDFPTDAGLDLLSGVDFKKGCFIGQEVLSRMKRRGTIRRRPMITQFSGDASPRGTPLMAGKAQIGELRGGTGDTAIAFVRLDRLAAAKAPVTAAGRDVSIQAPTWLEASK